MLLTVPAGAASREPKESFMTLHRRIALAAALAVLLPSPAAFADASAPFENPKPAARDGVAAYNEGVKLMHDKRYGDAQRRFEEALAQREAFAEAHNNLAYVLRMQGSANFGESMRHYDRALAINPKLAQAYMYRGVLFTQMGDAMHAQQDLATLRGLDTDLAAKLERAIAANGREERDSVAGTADRVY
jgi:tetratricopeptide (TPR) repeat protein